MPFIERKLKKKCFKQVKNKNREINTISSIFEIVTREKLVAKQRKGLPL